MTVNHYFQGGQGIGNQSEKRLYEDLIVEGLKIYGHDVYYLPRTLVNRDLILGEDVNSRFDDSYLIEMYMETTEGFAGQQELINKFGLEIREDTTFMISKRTWDQKVGNEANLIATGRPNEGDIIYMPLMNSFFEILFVEDQEPFFQLGSLPAYKLRVTRWEYSGEELNTGNNEIDEKETIYSLNQLSYKSSLEPATMSLLVGNPIVTGDKVTGIPIIQGGEDYTTVPVIVISDPLPSISALATANVTGNTLSSFTITQPGRGYTSNPQVTITYIATDNSTKVNDESNAIVVNGQVISIPIPVINDITSITSVAISPALTATKASASPNVVNGVVESISITVQGTSYLGLSPTATVSLNTAAEGSVILENSVDTEVYYLIDEDYKIQNISAFASNDDLNEEAGFNTETIEDDILDFTERNPFGEID
jgi:hypothetical protein